MYAQSVGTLPVASRTGGLADTVEDGVTGFLFEETSLAGLLGAMYRAVDIYASPRKLKAMRRAAMRRPFGWGRRINMVPFTEACCQLVNGDQGERSAD
jgi:starch synthase